MRPLRLVTARRWLLVAAFAFSSAALTACPDEETSGNPDADTVADTTPDVQPDTQPDVEPDTEPDVVPDVEPDTEPDVVPDTEPDIVPDVEPDTEPDVVPDAVPDVEPDAIPDAEPDAIPDVEPDVIPDVEPDAVPDVGPDAELDVADGEVVETMVEVTFTFTAFGSDTALVGATVTFDGDVQTTDDLGSCTFFMPPEVDFEVTVTASGMPDHYIYNRAPAQDGSFGYSLATDATINGLELALGASVDPADGLMSVAPREKADGGSIEEMTIDLDSAYDLALVFDSEASLGVSMGNTTLVGSQSTVIFVNITPGAATPTFTHASGYVCDVGPIPVDVPADAYVIANYECEVP